ITFRRLEANQDLLTYPLDSMNVGNQLWRYLTGPDGQAYLHGTRCQRMSSTINSKFAGANIILTYRKAQLKIYPKTHHGLRVEVMVSKHNIQEHCGNRSAENLHRIIEEIVKPTLQNANIPRVIRELPPAKNITPLLLEHLIDDPTILHMAKKTLEHRALTKDEVPRIYRNKGKKHLYKAEKTGREWLYYLRPQLLAEIDWYPKTEEGGE
ncbi:MAG: hypothetical protein QCI38_09095, partial [Candidatus Thermoplasmatota archaeon]|nr:hypothetical protein [Candidatus Thermoplasmatota archaeon]